MAKKTATETNEATNAPRSRIHILRPVGAVDYKGSRLVDATSKTAAKVHVADQLYTVEVASARHVDAAYKAGATMEVAGAEVAP
jgi:hypothetical protein